MIKNGISEENLMKLFTHAQIGPKEQDMVRNLANLGVSIVSDVSRCFFQFNWSHYSHWFILLSRVVAIRSTPFRARSASPNTHTKCPDGHRSSKTLWRIALRTNWMPDTFHSWPVVRRAPPTKDRQGNLTKSQITYQPCIQPSYPHLNIVVVRDTDTGTRTRRRRPSRMCRESSCLLWAALAIRKCGAPMRWRLARRTGRSSSVRRTFWRPRFSSAILARCPKRTRCVAHDSLYWYRIISQEQSRFFAVLYYTLHI